MLDPIHSDVVYAIAAAGSPVAAYVASKPSPGDTLRALATEVIAWREWHERFLRALNELPKGGPHAQGVWFARADCLDVPMAGVAASPEGKDT